MIDPAAKNLTPTFFLRRRFWRCLAVLSFVIVCAAAASAQIRVPGNSGSRWVDSGIDVDNGTQIQVSATGVVVDARGAFGPEGTLNFRSDVSFPADGPVFALVIRLTSSRTYPQDELREDYFYSTDRTICFRAPGHLWLTVNDNHPEDNTGQFLVTITRGACARTDPGGRATRVRVADQTNANVAGADVYVNGIWKGATGSDGTRLVPELRNRDLIVARKLIHENPTSRPSHRTGSTRSWNYRVYLTTMPVNNDGTLSPFVVGSPTITQELRLNRANTLIGIHLVASVEWDASEAEFRRIEEQILAGSQGLYNATDGQFFFEQVDLRDLSVDWSSADMHVFTNWSLRATADANGFFGSAPGMNMQRLSWSYVYTHEFGHYGLDLYDEYSDTDNNVYCTGNVLNMSSAYRQRQPQAACLMWNNAPKLCSNHPANRHTRGIGRGDEDCWTHTVNTYMDRSTPSRWTLQSPNSRGAIPGTLPEIPVDSWHTNFSVDNRREIGLCEPRLITLTDASGRLLFGVSIFNRTFSGGRILQGMTRTDDMTTPEDETGQMLATGVHERDELITSDGTIIRLPACTYVTRNDSQSDGALALAAMDSLTFRSVSLSGQQRFAHTTPRGQQSSTVIVVKPSAFDLALSLEPGRDAGQMIVRVRPGTELNNGPQVQFMTRGEKQTRSIPMSFDQKTSTYIGIINQLPLQGTGIIEATATDMNGSHVERLSEVSFTPLPEKKDAEIFSADGQLSLAVPAGALPPGSRIIIGPSDAPRPSLAEDFIVASGPFKVSSSAQDVMNQTGALRFRLPNQLVQSALAKNDGVEGYDEKSFEIRRYNESTREWESGGGLLLREVAIVTLTTKRLGSYALVARPLSRKKNGVNQKPDSKKPDENVEKPETGGKKDEARKPEEIKKPEQIKKPVEGEKPATNFMVTDAGLRADEAKVSGPCPVTVKFGGYIAANGPGQVQYTFTRSDGANGPTFTLDFKTAGTQYVNTTWTLGGQGLGSYEGWQAIKILSPNEFESSHETGSFAMECQGPEKPVEPLKPSEGEKPTANFMVTDASLKADDARVSGPCPVTIKFGGYITANGPGQVQYTFTRSDGATGPTFTLDFKGAGTQYVSTTWTLGGQGLNSYEGWQAIKILSPNDFESSRETGSFAMKCEGKTR